MKTDPTCFKTWIWLFLLILPLFSCSSYKPIANSSKTEITSARLSARVNPEKKYKVIFKGGATDSRIQEVLVKVRRVTADTLYCDVETIYMTVFSKEIGGNVTKSFSHVSRNGTSTNKRWFWSDHDKRLIGLGHLSINSISEISQQKFSAGKTAILCALLIIPPVIAVEQAVENPLALGPLY